MPCMNSSIVIFLCPYFQRTLNDSHLSLCEYLNISYASSSNFPTSKCAILCSAIALEQSCIISRFLPAGFTYFFISSANANEQLIIITKSTNVLINSTANLSKHSICIIPMFMLIDLMHSSFILQTFSNMKATSLRTPSSVPPNSCISNLGTATLECISFSYSSSCNFQILCTAPSAADFSSIMRCP